MKTKPYNYIHTPYSVPEDILEKLNKQGNLSNPSCSPDTNPPRLRDTHENYTPTENQTYFTIFCDPSDRLNRIFKISNHDTWDKFMDCEKCRQKWIRGNDYYAGSPNNSNPPHIETVPIEKTDRLREILGEDFTPFSTSDYDTKKIPSWARHIINQHHPHQARHYGHDTTPPSCKNAENKSIIIVGSNKCINNSMLGEQIDSYDLVVRCNNSPRQGYETDVGSKLDIAMINAVFTQYATEHPHPQSLPYTDPEENIEVWHPLYRAVRGIYKYRMGYFPILLTDTLYETAWEKLGAAPSSGLLAVMAAANFGFKRISIAGFGPLKNENTFSHYYDEANAEASQCNFIGENQLLREWLDHSLIDSLDRT